jgi:hypothetical protein
MSENSGGGWLQPGMFRAGSGQDLPVVSVTRLPPELEQQQARRTVPALRGEPGYSEAGEAALAAGSVRGYRWWGLTPGGTLLGMHAPWEPGENTARCLIRDFESAAVHPDSGVPAKGCHCGFYAWWTVQPRYATGSLLPVLGVIEGYGRVRTGTKGFRCAKARILALAPLTALEYGRVRPDVEAMARRYLRSRVVYGDAEAMLAEFPPDPACPQ